MTALVAAPQEVAEGPETHDKSEHADHDPHGTGSFSVPSRGAEKAAAMFDKFRPGAARRLWPTLLLIGVICAIGVAMALVMSE
jgi:hypothetical protein